MERCLGCTNFKCKTITIMVTDSNRIMDSVLFYINSCLYLKSESPIVDSFKTKIWSLLHQPIDLVLISKMNEIRDRTQLLLDIEQIDVKVKIKVEYDDDSYFLGDHRYYF